MTVPIQIIDDRAVLDANPTATVETFLDRWNDGYIASIGALDNQYVIKKVIYDLDKVSIDKVREVAKKIDSGEFSCPVCQRIATQSTGNNGEGKLVKEEHKEEPVLKEIEEVKEPELELDEVEIIEQERNRAIQKIVSAMDEILLMRMLR